MGFIIGRDVLYRQPMISNSLHIISLDSQINLRKLELPLGDFWGLSLRSKRFIEVFISRLITCLEGLFIVFGLE
jgi:hypothetical protein